jgi:AraC-like DNA-binding protein
MSGMGDLHRHHRIIPAPIETPMASILVAGVHLFGHGVNTTGKLRTYPGGALVLVTRGEGIYKDASGKRSPLKRGDAILVFPGNPHWYGPQKNQIFDEIYVAFEGPLFESWFSSGVMDPTQPIRHLGEKIDDAASWLLLWIEKFAETKELSKQIRALTGLVSFFAEVSVLDGMESKGADHWLNQAKSALTHDLKGDIDLQEVAQRMDMGYEAFRKKFQARAGVAPLKYRNDKKIEAAKHLFQYSPQIGNREVAEALGFSDEFHFSKRFRTSTGESPHSYRKRLSNESA